MLATSGRANPDSSPAILQPPRGETMCSFARVILILIQGLRFQSFSPPAATGGNYVFLARVSLFSYPPAATGGNYMFLARVSWPSWVRPSTGAFEALR